MPSIHHTATRIVMLLALALLAGTSAGCQCCAWYERYMDCVDHVSDHEGNAQVCYRPWYDLTRIGRVDWPWACCQKCPPPGFVYNTPITHRVLSRLDDPQQQMYSEPASPAPPPLLPNDIWSQPSDAPLEGDDVGVYPLGPLFESEEATIPPSPEAIEVAPPAPGIETLDPPLPPSEARRQAAPPRQRNFESREPTPATQQLPVSSEIDTRNVPPHDWRNDSGVVRLFDSETPASGMTMHRVDQDEYAPIKLDTWLSDRESGVSDAETASSGATPWAPASQPTDTSSRVTPSAGWDAGQTTQRAERAQWWDEPAASASGRSSVSPTPSNSRSADDVFGAAPFAEWQSVNE